MGIFGKLLTSYVLLSLFVVVVAGVVSFALSVDSITSETLAELSEQAQFMAEYSAQVDPSVDPLFFEKSQRDDFMVLEAYGDEFIAHRKKNPQSDWEITEIIDEDILRLNITVNDISLRTDFKRRTNIAAEFDDFFLSQFFVADIGIK